MGCAYPQPLLDRISIASCHRFVGFAFVRHDSDIFVQAQMPLAAPFVPFRCLASTAHSLSALLSSFRLSGSPPLGMTSLLLACTLFSNWKAARV